MITEEIANQVWDVLVEKAGANDGVEGEAFLHHAIGQNYVQEYRFQGELGFGGKVFLRDHSMGWRVYYYPEDRNSIREKVCERTNKALAKIQPTASA